MKKQNKDKFEDYDTVDVEEELTLNQKVDKMDKEKSKKIKKKIFTKIFLFFFTILLIISTFSIVSFCIVGKSNQKAGIKNLQTTDKLIYTEKRYENKELIDKMENFINSLPKTQQDALKDDWKIIICEEIPKGLANKSFASLNTSNTSEMIAAGVTFTYARTIVLSSKLDTDKTYSAFIHEMGHFVSFEYASQHGSKKWESIYDKYKDTYKADKYSLSNEAEFFANSYEEYYCDTEKIKNEAPDAYEFIDSLNKKEINDANIIATFFEGWKNTFNILRSYIKDWQRNS